MKTFSIVALVTLGIGSLIVLPIALVALRLVALPFRALDRGIGTAEGVIDRTLTAENAIYNYEWFKQQSQDIKAGEAKISIAMQSVDSFEQALGSDRSTWTFEDKTEWARLRSVEQGLRSHVETLIADYNARASMANRDIFRDGLIPNLMTMSANLIR